MIFVFQSSAAVIVKRFAVNVHSFGVVSRVLCRQSGHSDPQNTLKKHCISLRGEANAGWGKARLKALTGAECLVYGVDTRIAT